MRSRAAFSNGAEMTSRERVELTALVRRREKVAKSEASHRSAELMADFEQQLAARYEAQDEHWSDLTSAAQQVVDEADARIAQRCRELGIPEQFRPSIQAQWYGRGENASKERRAELRKVAQTRIAAIEKEAKATIEKRSVEVQTALLAGGLESEAARRFLESMPTAEALMPPLDVEALNKALPMRSYGYSGLAGYQLTPALTSPEIAAA